MAPEKCVTVRREQDQYPSSSASSAIIVDDSDESNEPKKQEPGGSVCEAKNLYETKSECFCCKNWAEEIPEELKEDPRDTSERAKYALLVRYRKKHGAEKAMELDSIVVQSQELKPILAEIFEGFEGITTGLKNLTFRAPFKPFFYRWEKLQEALTKSWTETARAHLSLLYDTIQSEVSELIDTHKDMLNHGVITFSTLWTLFRPGDLIYSPYGGQDQIFKMVDSTNTPGVLLPRGLGYQISCKSVDWNGYHFGFSQQNLSIHPFGGTKKISDLEAYPINFHPDQAALEEKLSRRGKLCEEYAGCHYKAYRGPVHSTARWRTMHAKQELNGRIMIDAEAYHNWSGNPHPILASLDAVSFAPRMDAPDQEHQNNNNNNNVYHGKRGRGYNPGPPPPPPGMFDPPVLIDSSRLDDDLFETDVADGGVGVGGDAEQEEGDKLTEEHCLLCIPYVKGYSLKTKEWAQFHVDHVEEIKWNENAFASLVLPGGYKELILSFVESQIANKDLFDDVIEGKGQGIVMLLHGEPGVGKTLTAESVSEQMRTPLYAISGGELGETAEQVEEKLNQILEIASKWDAVLLLDESDVFLEQRVIKDLERNKIVAIFLRMLEYYRGILFMTTNRILAFDPAFKSRIHLTVHYPTLSESARKHIWSNFLKLSSVHNRNEVEITDKDLGDLALVKLNGREIKNVVKTAQLLAARGGGALKLEHVRTVLKVTQEGGGFEG